MKRRQENPSAREIFGSRAGRYEELEVFSREKYYEPLLDVAGPQAGESVLDIGAGTGLLAVMLARHAGEVTGIDVTPEMLKRARSRAAEAGAGNIRFLEAEASSLPFPDETFDLVTSRTAFHHFPDPLAALKEINRVLKQGGRLVVEDVIGPEDDETRERRELIEKLFDPSHVLAYRLSEMKGMLARAGYRLEKVVRPETKPLPLEFILDLESPDEETTARIKELLRRDIGRDLGGFRAWEEDGRFILSWQTAIVAAVKE